MVYFLTLCRHNVSKFDYTPHLHFKLIHTILIDITTDYDILADIIYLNIFAAEYKYRLQTNRILSNVSEVALASDLRKTFKIDSL